MVCIETMILTCSIKSEEAIHAASVRLVLLISLLYFFFSESVVYSDSVMKQTKMDTELHAIIALTDVPFEEALGVTCSPES